MFIYPPKTNFCSWVRVPWYLIQYFSNNRRRVIGGGVGVVASGEARRFSSQKISSKTHRTNSTPTMIHYRPRNKTTSAWCPARNFMLNPFLWSAGSGSDSQRIILHIWREHDACKISHSTRAELPTSYIYTDAKTMSSCNKHLKYPTVKSWLSLGSRGFPQRKSR